MKKWIKIAMLIDGWTPIFWWWQVHVKDLCEWLILQYNCNIDLFVRKLKDNKWKTFNNNEILLNGKFRIFRVWPSTKFFNIFWRLLSLISTTFYLWFLCYKEKYDIIHAHAYVSWLPAKIISILFNIPIIYSVHGSSNLDTWNKWLISSIEKWLLTWIRYDLEITDGTDFLKYTNINTNVICIPLWIDINHFISIKWLQKYKWNSFLRVGRFSWEKWIIYLIKWIWLIDNDILEKNNFRLNLVWDGEDKGKILNLIKKLWIEKYIKFKWKLFWKDLVEEYKKNKFFILPSLTEWFWLVVIEAMASWLVTIATKCWWPEDIIHDKENGFLIEKWSTYSIKNIIEEMFMKNNKELNIIIKNAETLVKEKFSKEKMVDNIYKEYISFTK